MWRLLPESRHCVSTASFLPVGENLQVGAQNCNDPRRERGGGEGGGIAKEREQGGGGWGWGEKSVRHGDTGGGDEE